MRITDPSKIQTYYQALLDRNDAYVGIFYVGVKTTSVFCIASCRARKPKLENVEFYTQVKEALDSGYRPCKICKPTQHAHQAPEQVEAAIRLVQNHPKEKISDDRLRADGISPELVRRWFKQHYGMTFQAYQRMYRINTAYQELRQGKSATATAFDTGFDSLSGFGYTYKKILGKSPAQSLTSSPILINRLTTPLGPMFVAASEEGICLLEFVDRKRLESELTDIQRLFKQRIIAGENVHIKQLKRELAEYFAGEQQHFEVPIHKAGTDFQRSVWDELERIPFGQTVSYQQLALNIHNPKAVRAVGAANGANRMSILLPCHRVVGSNGQLTGYGGGIERKRWLLDFEKKHRIEKDL
ncbi:MAG: methylated-DNA--[protein]-cysteine S-methyltransferase [Bacteroidota bacterium]